MSDQQIDKRDQEVIGKFRSVVEGKERQKKKKKIRTGLFGGCLAVCGAALLASFFCFSFEKPPKSAAPLPPVDNTPMPIKMAQTSRLQPLKPITIEVHEAPEPERKAPGNIRIAALVPCLKVKGRQYISSQPAFPIEKDGRPDVWVWMDVRSEKDELPYTLRHIYFFEDHKYASVALNIKCPRMRTWSNLTLEHDRYAGKWHVKVVTAEGKKLAETGFEMTP